MKKAVAELESDRLQSNLRTKTAHGKKKTVFVHRCALFGGLSTDAIFIRVHTLFHCFICLKINHKLEIGFCVFSMTKGLIFSPIILAVSARVILSLDCFPSAQSSPLV